MLAERQDRSRAAGPLQYPPSVFRASH